MQHDAASLAHGGVELRAACGTCQELHRCLAAIGRLEWVVGFIDDFMVRYAKEFDFYENVARRARDLIDAELGKEGVKGAVTHRAKSIDRLEAKCRQRDARTGKAYGSVDAIFEDIVDLAGVRIALYFPSDGDIVASIISRIFDVIGDPKVFPDVAKERPGDPRFSGYAGKHFRVRFKDAALSSADKRYANAKIEIQIASVFMHGWSEVEHDLVYKPLDGGLSEEEYSLLDQLNGLAMSAEIALENLRKAMKRRVTERKREFGNHYELTTYLLDRLGISDRESITGAGLGRMDQLFLFLGRLDLNRPMALDEYVDSLHDQFERRPLADQVIDELLRNDESRYGIYEQVRNRSEVVDSGILGNFMLSWIKLERLERELHPGGPAIRSFGRQLERSGILDADMAGEIGAIRNMRNRIVHGQDDSFSIADIENATERLNGLTRQISETVGRRNLHGEVMPTSVEQSDSPSE